MRLIWVHKVRWFYSSPNPGILVNAEQIERVEQWWRGSAIIFNSGRVLVVNESAPSLKKDIEEAK